MKLYRELTDFDENLQVNIYVQTMFEDFQFNIYSCPHEVLGSYLAQTLYNQKILINEKCLPKTNTFKEIFSLFVTILIHESGHFAHAFLHKDKKNYIKNTPPTYYREAGIKFI